MEFALERIKVGQSSDHIGLPGIQKCLPQRVHAWKNKFLASIGFLAINRIYAV
jgi:hypothetical protein